MWGHSGGKVLALMELLVQQSLCIDPGLSSILTYVVVSADHPDLSCKHSEHLGSIYCVPGTSLRGLCAYFSLNPHNPYEAGPAALPIS